MNKETIDIKSIFESQKEFFNTFKTFDYDFRIASLKKLKEAIKGNLNNILDALKHDLNKSTTEAILTEVWFVIEEIDDMIKNLKKWMKPKKVKTALFNQPAKSYHYYSPLGVNLIISPWNYPFQLSMCPLAACIASGNTAIIKPSQNAVFTAQIIEKIISETFDSSYCYVFMGSRNESSLLLEQNFDHIFFTGGKAAGKIILDSANKHLTKVTLELGGKSPCIIDETCNIDKTAKRIAFGKLINSGQTCVAPDYAICPASIYDKLLDKISKYYEEFYPDALNNESFGKIVNERQFNSLVELLAKSNVYYGGKSLKDKLKIMPSIVKASIDDEIMKNEIFGPILPVIKYENKNEIYDIISNNPNPLACYIFSEDKKFINEMVNRVSFGGGCVNDTIFHLVGSSLPFGGVKESGHGNYHGHASFATFSHQKSILKRKELFDIAAKYPPYSTKKTNFLRRFLNI